MTVELDLVSGRTAELVRLAHAALNHATAAHCGGVEDVSGSLVRAGEALRVIRAAVEEHAVAIRAARTPGTDLGAIVTAAHVNADVESMEDLIRQLVQIAAVRSSRSAVPVALRELVCRMGQSCGEMVATAGTLLASPDAGVFARLEGARVEMGRMQAYVRQRLMAGSDGLEIDAAVDAALTSRLYVRCAELAVSMSQQAVLGS